jgi:formate hydrogenlyase subunit 3/multisubunit Na+/H+ antiporter MnhD subunit
MQAFRQAMFYLGFVLGLATAGLVAGVALTYLFTGKVALVEMREGNLKAQLLTPDEVIASVRHQVEKARAGQVPEAGGGEEDA